MRHTALPQPGTDVELRQLLGRIFSQRLDRSKPLWELWLVQGLEDGQFALISKTHHALVDGVSGVDIATVLFDLTPVPAQAPVEEPWTPQPEPSEAELVAEGVKALVRTPFGIARQARRRAAASRASTLEQAREAVEGVGEVAWAGLNPAPDVPLNVPIGPHRRVRWARSQPVGLQGDQGRARRHGQRRRAGRRRGRAGALAAQPRRCAPRASSCARSCRSRSAPWTSAARSATASPRCAGRCRSTSTTRSSGCASCATRWRGLKDSKQALGAEVIAGLSDFAPPTLLAQASRLNFSTRLFNLIVTNVPGPQFPLYLLGREMLEIVPIAFLPENHALAIAIMSYNGELDFGLLGDYDAMPDLEALGQFLEDSLAELLGAAREATAEQQRRAAAKADTSANGKPAKKSSGNGKSAKKGSPRPRKASGSAQRASDS